MRRRFFYLLSVPYLDREEDIKLCKKFPYSYSTRLAFQMPGFYHLTISISRHLESYPLTILKNLRVKEITSNIQMVPNRAKHHIYMLYIINLVVRENNFCDYVNLLHMVLVSR